MAVFAGIDLKRWREAQHISAADLAERISCDTTTIYRYESGKIRPDPDVMFELCDALGDTGVWTTWMRSEYPRSYGRVHPELMPLNLQGALMSLFAETKDLIEIEKQALRDGADGHVDDTELSLQLEQAATGLIQSAQRVLGLIDKQRAG